VSPPPTHVPTPADAVLPPRARFDLHMHSDRSDGRLAPELLLQRCAEGGLDVVALTDHDSVPALKPGTWRVGGRTIRVVHAAEVSGVHEGREYHLLVYFPGTVPGHFAELLRSLSEARAERYAQAAARLGLDGVPPPDELARRGERALTRLHLAQALVDAGHVRDLEEAFRRYAGHRTGNVPLVALDYREAIGMARQAGGFTSWAHPPLDAVQSWLAAFVDAGLQGLEACRPGLRGSERSTLLRLAHKHGLLVTGGSDYHGFPGQRPPGQWSFPLREALPFARALGLRA